MPESVRVDPQRRLLEIRLSPPFSPADADGALLAAGAGAAILDHAPFGTVIVVEAPRGRREPPFEALVRDLATESRRLGATRVALVGLPLSGSSGTELTRFDDEDSARCWAERATPAGDA